ncbi:hypothetical protein AB0C18_37900 [Nonomuraea muscovyensis]|uniref:hypothetical protein n=1 Tax=Nonomuraea muscovyensis TaxID=1124761 RepID=UPI00340D56B5
MSTHVVLSVDFDTMQRGIEYERQVYENACAKQEIARIKQFRATVLSDPADAVAYWMLKHPTALDVEVLGQMERLVDKLGIYAPSASWVEVAKIIRKFLDETKPEAVQDLAQILRWSLHNYGHHQSASRIAELFQLDAKVADA